MTTNVRRTVLSAALLLGLCGHVGGQSPSNPGVTGPGTPGTGTPGQQTPQPSVAPAGAEVTGDGVWERLPDGSYLLNLMLQPPRSGGTPLTVRYPGGELRLVWRVPLNAQNLAGSRSGLLYNAETDPALTQAQAQTQATRESGTRNLALSPAGVTPSSPVTAAGAGMSGTGTPGSPATPGTEAGGTPSVNAAAQVGSGAVEAPGIQSGGPAPDPAFGVRAARPSTAPVIPAQSAPPVARAGSGSAGSAIPRPAPALVTPTITLAPVKAATVGTSVSTSDAVAQAGTAATRTLTGQARPEVKAEVKAEPKPEVKPEVKAEPKPEVKPEVKAEPKPEVKAPVNGAATCAALEVRGTLLERRLYSAGERSGLLSWWRSVGGASVSLNQAVTITRGGERVTLLDFGSGLCVQRTR